MARGKTNTDELLDELLKDCQLPQDIFGQAGFLKGLTKRLVALALQAEWTNHPGYETHTGKTVQNAQGPCPWRSPVNGRVRLNRRW